MLILIWLASVPAAEIFFRVVGDRPSDDLSGLYSPFVDGSYKLGPRVETHAFWSAGKFSVYTDELGLRCDRDLRLATHPGDRPDAIILGDSQGFGNGVNFEESVAGVVANLAASEGLRLANASVGGHGTRNQLALARWLRDEQNVSASTYILFATPQMVTYPESFNRSFVGSDGRLYEGAMGTAARLRLWSKTHTVVYNRWRDAFRNFGIGTRPKEDASQVLQVYGGGPAEEITRAKLTSFLNELRDFTQRGRARLIIAYFPLTVEADLGAVRRAAEKLHLQVDSDRPSRILSQSAKELGIPCHDLRPVLAKLHAKGEPLRLKGDFHYDRVLSKACGEELWNVLRSEMRATGNAANQSKTSNNYGQ